MGTPAQHGLSFGKLFTKTWSQHALIHRAEANDWFKNWSVEGNAGIRLKNHDFAY